MVYERTVRCVDDGDSFVVRLDGKDTFVRLVNVSAPDEIRESMEAKKILKNLIEGKKVTIRTVASTADGGWKADLVFADDGEVVNVAMREALTEMAEAA